MTDAELVSVIIPSHNYASFLADTLDSVRRQSHATWECLIVDDGSTDETPDVAARFVARDDRIRYVRHEKQGPSAARNTGLSITHGPFIQFLDADDLLEADKLAEHVAFLKTHPDVDLVFTADSSLGTEAWQVPDPDVFIPDQPVRGEPLIRALVTRNVMVANAPLFRRSLVDAVGEFDVGLQVVEDWDYWLRSALAGQTFAFVSQMDAGVLVRHHPASLSRDRSRMLRASVELRDKIHDRLPGSLQSLNRRLRAGLVARLAVGMALDGDVWRGTRLLLSAAIRERRPAWFAVALGLPLLAFGPVRGALRPRSRRLV